MQSSLSNILRLIHDLSGSTASSLLRLFGNEFHVVAHFGNIPTKYLDDLHKDIALSTGELNCDITGLSSFNILSDKFGIKSVYSEKVIRLEGSAPGLILLLLSEVENRYDDSKQNDLKILVAFLRDFLIERNWFKQDLDLERIFAKADMGIFLHNSDAKLIFINRKGFELLRIKPEQFDLSSGNKLNLNFFDEDGQPLTRNEYPPIKALKTRQNIVDRNLKYIDELGNYYWFRINSTLIKDESGRITEVLSTVNDVTAFRNIEEYLKDTTRTIESILYSSDVKGANYFFITEAVKKILGFSPHEIKANYKTILRNIHPEDFSLFKNFARNLQSGKASVIEYRIKDSFGNEHYLRNSGFPVIQGNEVVRIDGVIVDITDEKKILQELERSEERFRLLIETANDLIFNLDSYGYFLTVNNYGALALGFKPEDMIGRHFLEFADDENKIEIAMAFQ